MEVRRDSLAPERCWFKSSLAHHNPPADAIPEAGEESSFYLVNFCQKPGIGWDARNKTEVSMSTNEARKIVEDGLERKRIEREQRDAALEDQARQLRLTISGNHAEKTMSEIQRKAREEAEARERRAERVRAKAARVYRDMKVEQIVRSYGVLCLLILLLTAVTRLNILVSIALVLGMGVFPAVDIYRLYFPVKGVKK